MKHTLLFLALAALISLGLSAQTPAPTPSPAMGMSGTPQPSTPAATPAQNQLVGTWKVERAIYDLYMSLKDVTGSDESFYSSLMFGSNGKGKVQYNQKSEQIDVEYDLRDGSLSIAYGSRLKPQVDLYRLVPLNDGTLFLKSQRLASRNGTIHYILRRAE